MSIAFDCVNGRTINQSNNYCGYSNASRAFDSLIVDDILCIGISRSCFVDVLALILVTLSYFL